MDPCCTNQQVRGGQLCANIVSFQQPMLACNMFSPVWVDQRKGGSGEKILRTLQYGQCHEIWTWGIWQEQGNVGGGGRWAERGLLIPTRQRDLFRCGGYSAAVMIDRYVRQRRFMGSNKIFLASGKVRNTHMPCENGAI